MAVVALCTLENDVIHAGYLALALLFFRCRDALRSERNRWAPGLQGFRAPSPSLMPMPVLVSKFSGIEAVLCEEPVLHVP